MRQPKQLRRPFLHASGLTLQRKVLEVATRVGFSHTSSYPFQSQSQPRVVPPDPLPLHPDRPLEPKLDGPTSRGGWFDVPGMVSLLNMFSTASSGPILRAPQSPEAGLDPAPARTAQSRHNTCPSFLPQEQNRRQRPGPKERIRLRDRLSSVTSQARVGLSPSRKLQLCLVIGLALLSVSTSLSSWALLGSSFTGELPERYMLLPIPFPPNQTSPRVPIDSTSTSSRGTNSSSLMSRDLPSSSSRPLANGSVSSSDADAGNVTASRDLARGQKPACMDVHVTSPPGLSESEYAVGRYLVYLPFSGTTNQIIGFLTAVSLAQLLNRTLVVPPLLPSKHELPWMDTCWREHVRPVSLYHVFDIDRYLASRGAKGINIERVVSHLRRERNATCQHWGDRTEFMSETSYRLLPFYEIPWPSQQVQSLWDNRHRRVVCARNPFFRFWIDGEEIRAQQWALLRFAPELVTYAKEFVQREFNGQRFAAVHIRRTDKTRGLNLTAIHRSNRQIRDRLRLEIAQSPFRDITNVFVATDERDKDQLLEMQSFGWKRFPGGSNFLLTDPALANHSRALLERYGPLAAMLMDSAILSFAHVFLGDGDSTVSLCTKARVIAWNHGHSACLQDYESGGREDFKPP